MEDKTAVDVLREARELIAKPGGWTQGAYARTATRASCTSDNPQAICFCIVGALHRVQTRELPTFAAYKAARRALEAQAGVLADWNDTPGRTQAEVVALFDAAISRASR